MNRLTDFTDWLSPMLVKELRQGVRSRVFVYALLLLQGSLVLQAIVGLVASDAGQDTEGVSQFFWLLAGVFLILFLPLSGLNGISNERTSNTLELIFLTRLSSRRIVAGKWLALVAQITLLVFTILPYIVLRYFLGGVDLWRELLTTGELLVGSALLSAITVGLSTLPVVLSRLALAAGIILGLFILASVMPSLGMRRGPVIGGSFSTAWKDYSAAGTGAIFVIVYMLEFGAARIAPPAENHSSPLRLIGLGAIAAGVLMDRFIFQEGDVWTLIAFCFTLPVLIGALCESPRAITSIYRPFVRRGFLGRAAGGFLYPGWPSATPYALLVLLAVGLESYLKGPAQYRADIVFIMFIVPGVLLFPAAIVRLFGRRMRYPMATYLGVQAISVLFYTFASALYELKAKDIRPILDVIPTCALFSYIYENRHDELLALLPIPGGVTILCVLVLLWSSWRPWRVIQAFEKKAALMNDDPGQPAPTEAAVQPAVS
jgi:hypothetical protein